MTCPYYKKCMCFQCDKTDCPYWTDKEPDWLNLLVDEKELEKIKTIGKEVTKDERDGTAAEKD